MGRVVLVNDRGRVVGQDHHRAKLDDHEVWLVHELRDAGLSYSQIAAKFEVSKSLVAGICTWKRRCHVVIGQKTINTSPPRSVRIAVVRPGGKKG